MIDSHILAPTLSLAYEKYVVFNKDIEFDKFNKENLSAELKRYALRFLFIHLLKVFIFFSIPFFSVRKPHLSNIKTVKTNKSNIDKSQLKQTKISFIFYIETTISFKHLKAI